MKQLIAFILCFFVSMSVANAEDWFSVADLPGSRSLSSNLRYIMAHHHRRCAAHRS